MTQKDNFLLPATTDWVKVIPDDADGYDIINLYCSKRIIYVNDFQNRSFS